MSHRPIDLDSRRSKTALTEIERRRQVRSTPQGAAAPHLAELGQRLSLPPELLAQLMDKGRPDWPSVCARVEALLRAYSASLRGDDLYTRLLIGRVMRDLRTLVPKEVEPDPQTDRPSP